MKLSFSPRQAQFLARLMRRGATAAKKAKAITPPGWNKPPFRAELASVEKRLLGGELHKIGIFDAAHNNVGYALVKKKHGTATVDMLKHYQDSLGTTSSPIGAKEILSLKRKFVKDNPDVHTFKFDRVYEPGTHENFRTKRFYRWHGLKMRRQSVPVKGREHLALAEKARVRKRNLRAGTGTAFGAGAGLKGYEYRQKRKGQV